MDYQIKKNKLGGDIVLNDKLVSSHEAYIFAVYKPIWLQPYFTNNPSQVQALNEIIETLNKINNIDQISNVWQNIVKIINQYYNLEEINKIPNEKAANILNQVMAMISDIKSGEKNTQASVIQNDLLADYEEDLSIQRYEIKIILDVISCFFRDLMAELEIPKTIPNSSFLCYLDHPMFLEDILFRNLSEEDLKNLDMEKQAVIISSNPLKFGTRRVVSVLPTAELTKLFVHIKMIKDDINQIAEILKSQKEDYSRRLLAKYIVIEALEFHKFALQLINLINRESRTTKSQIQPVDKLTSKRISSFFKESQNPFWIKIRNTMAAHRDFDNIEMSDMIDNWDYLTVETINELLTVIHTTYSEILVSNHFLFSKFAMEGIALEGVLDTVENLGRKPFFKR